MNLNSIQLNGKWLHPDGEWKTGSIWIEEHQIRSTESKPSIEANTVDLPEGAVILPGFIDLQVNGGFGIDFRDQPEGIQEISKQLPKYGVTSYLPTIVTSPIDQYPGILSKISLAPADLGANPLGIHIEGPFLNPMRKGAHPSEWLCLPDPDLVKPLLREGIVRLFTFAPELPGGRESIALIREKGIIPAVGHSNATYEQAKTFISDLGYGVHLFDAMPPIHHRDPGLISALLEPEAPPVGVIADFVHVHPAIIRLAFNCRGVEGMTLVSDASTLAGLPPKTYHTKGHTVIIDEKSARLSDGTLAGSTVFLDTAVRNIVRSGICDLADVTRMVSSTPAKVLGMEQHKGKIAQGYDADLVVLDQELNVVLTIVGGKIAYKR